MSSLVLKQDHYHLLGSTLHTYTPSLCKPLFSELSGRIIEPLAVVPNRSLAPLSMPHRPPWQNWLPINLSLWYLCSSLLLWGVYWINKGRSKTSLLLKLLPLLLLYIDAYEPHWQVRTIPTDGLQVCFIWGLNALLTFERKLSDKWLLSAFDLLQLRIKLLVKPYVFAHFLNLDSIWSLLFLLLFYVVPIFLHSFSASNELFQ